jgi:hypothetical protein
VSARGISERVAQAPSAASAIVAEIDLVRITSIPHEGVVV